MIKSLQQVSGSESSLAAINTDRESAERKVQRPFL